MNTKWNEKMERTVIKLENYGNSIALYILLISLMASILSLSLPTFDWSPNQKAFGVFALFFIGLSALHGVMWWILTREFLKLSPEIKRFLSSAIRLVRPVHMMTGMLGLGLVLLHGLSFITGNGFDWNGVTATGTLAFVALFLLALDGIGLMMSPFLSRAIHRWIAGSFLAFLVVHLWIVL
ncbi:hypothetical protein [Ferviditalea candida]|uniref:Cytochrome b561 bacterial/Ni-hydrogenase domain-containing protein n=1 Tax=Ferviditalea candida TaxID=3108399 RepID=A0ABU5ZEV7_9BACL|nr:hypothetical protein [Paenibacillaceae bacterium T2]